MPHSSPVALITGGARRVGRAISEDLARHGYSVIVHYNGSCGEAELVVDSIRANGGKASALQADLGNFGDLEGVIERATAIFGPLDVLINNASLFEEDAATDFDWATWDQHFDVHTKAPVKLARDFAAQLPAGRDGLVVNIIDQRVWRPTPRFFSYTLSKSALWTATRTLAQALAPSVRVNAIGPGPTLANSRQQQADFDKQVAGLLLQRGPALEEFGATIRYLVEARSVTGQMIALDGGQHLAWQTPDIAGIPE